MSVLLVITSSSCGDDDDEMDWVTVFSVTHGGFVDPAWFEPGALRDAARWLEIESPNPLRWMTPSRSAVW